MTDEVTTEVTGEVAGTQLLPPAPPADPSPGWYRHPTRPLEHRYWDGSGWHDQLESTPSVAVSHVALAPTTTEEQPEVGELWWDLRTDELRWTEETAALHGYGLRSRETTWEFMLSHVAEVDREAVAARSQRCRDGAALLHSQHRIVRADGRCREVLLVAAPVDGAAPQAFRGFLVEIAPPRGWRTVAPDPVLRQEDEETPTAPGLPSADTSIDLSRLLSVLQRGSPERQVGTRCSRAT